MMRYLLLLLLAWAGVVRLAMAHPSPSSELMLDLRRDQVVAEILLPLDQLELAMLLPLAAQPQQAVAAHDAALRAYLVGHIRPVAPDGRAWTVQVLAMAATVVQGSAELKASVALRPPAGAPVRHFDLEFSAISHQVPNHTVLVSLRRGWYDGALRPAPELLTTLHWGARTISLRQDEGSWWRGFYSLFQLGMDHIREGSDHLLFLFTLLLPAPLLAGRRGWGAFAGTGRTLRRLGAIVSAFTVGHSLTLVASATGLVSVPAQPVEVLIAASILVSALHAWRPLFPGREAWIAAGFGLIHGLAFASALTELQLTGGQLAGAILAFNAGIEAMQIMLVLAAAPCLLMLARTARYRMVCRLGAGAASAAAIAWLAERTLGLANPLDGSMAWLAGHAWWLLAAATVGAALWYRVDSPAPAGRVRGNGRTSEYR